MLYNKITTIINIELDMKLEVIRTSFVLDNKAHLQPIEEAKQGYYFYDRIVPYDDNFKARYNHLPPNKIRLEMGRAFNALVNEYYIEGDKVTITFYALKWYVELDTMEDLEKLAEKHGKLVVCKGEENSEYKLLIEIYDSHRE